MITLTIRGTARPMSSHGVDRWDAVLDGAAFGALEVLDAVPAELETSIASELHARALDAPGLWGHAQIRFVLRVRLDEPGAELTIDAPACLNCGRPCAPGLRYCGPACEPACSLCGLPATPDAQGGCDCPTHAAASVEIDIAEAGREMAEE